MANHYETLGLARDCTASDIRAAFRRLALETHPDKRRDAPADSPEFRRVLEAYETLRDPDRRRMYDACLDTGDGSIGEALAGLMAEVLAKALAQWKARRRTPPPSAAPPPASDVVIHVEATLQEMYESAVKKVVVRTLDAGETRSVALLVPLKHHEAEYRFEGVGDRAIAGGQAGDVVVRLLPRLPPHVRIDDVVDRFDLLIERDVTLREYLTATELAVELFPGRVLMVPYEPGKDVAAVHGAGLPWVGEENEDERGTAYVFFRLRPPPRRLPREVAEAFLAHLD